MIPQRSIRVKAKVGQNYTENMRKSAKIGKNIGISWEKKAGNCSCTMYKVICKKIGELVYNGAQKRYNNKVQMANESRKGGTSGVSSTYVA